VIRAIVRKGVGEYGHEFLGYRDGWRGPLERDSRALGVPEVRGILPRGGTILGSSRTNPFKEDGGPERIAENLEADRVDGLIAIGGEDTLGAASRLFEEGVNVVGVPKTIDNDLSATDYTFGFDTAVNIAMSAIDRLHTTAESHRRTLICEVMGRNAGWIALHAGLSGGANVILIPELEFDLDLVTDYIVRRFESQYSPIVVVAEGAKPKGGMPTGDGAPTDSFGHVRLGGIANWLEGEIEQRTGHEARATVLGHVQRGGTPTAFDRVLATRFGMHAIDAAHEGLWGKMAALRSTNIELVDLTEATAELKTVPESLYREAEVFFG
jgi:ATP-dependent phosphofructokinase / diphosphate-dependent phosphofructokinase